ncbi:oxidoreductase [Thalassococcus profundi]|uniref:Oxidoreductase n=1 Tax=Thalassococcus profundi TaxID=2282382 RepID=A0A369TL49_9RHOB|nr:aldo/keto reductase [Thalassococcus profundi]RDD65552.1 oxidoreductase [Thalassococcus profundi]
MERISLTPDLSLSRIVYGLWRLGDSDDTAPERVRDKIAACLDQGISSMDLADIYGGYTTEGVFGDALTPDLRARMEIVTKCDIVAPEGRHAAARVKHYDTSRAHIFASVDHSLRVMRCEVIDLLLLHRPDPLMDPQETGAALDDLVTAGKVRAVGVSNFRPWDWSLLQSAMTTPLCTNQIEISLLELSSLTNGDLAFMQERRIPPMAWSPLGGGDLFFDTRHAALRQTLERIGADQGVDETAVAIAWLLAHPARILPVLGTNNPDRIGRIGDAAKVSLDRQDWFEVYSHALGQEVD